MKLQILDDARQDLVDGFLFYEAQAKGLGDYFLDALFSDIDSLQFYAGIHPIRYGYYRLLTRRFPFAVYYRIVRKTVKVYAILHCRRNPGWIQKRLA